MTTPASTPSAAPKMPSSSASAVTMRRTWVRLPPTARTTPISRVRSRTLIVSVFSIPNAAGIRIKSVSA